MALPVRVSVCLYVRPSHVWCFHSIVDNLLMRLSSNFRDWLNMGLMRPAFCLAVSAHMPSNHWLDDCISLQFIRSTHYGTFWTSRLITLPWFSLIGLWFVQQFLHIYKSLVESNGNLVGKIMLGLSKSDQFHHAPPNFHRFQASEWSIGFDTHHWLD